MSEKFTLLIAGPDHDHVKNMVRLNHDAVATIVVSRWENGTNPVVSYSEKIVSNPFPDETRLKGLHNSQNIYLQATSVLAGLEKVETPYVIKTRSDEFFSNLSIITKSFNPEKLSCANIFVRDVSYRPYHISDHLFVGKTDRLRHAFLALKEYIETSAECDKFGILNSRTPAETKIALFYLQECGYKIEQLLSFSERQSYGVMKKEFNVFDVDALQPLCISSSVAGQITNYRKYVRRDSVLGLRYINSIDQMAQQGQLNLFLQRGVFKLRRLLSKVR